MVLCLLILSIMLVALAFAALSKKQKQTDLTEKPEQASGTQEDPKISPSETSENVSSKISEIKEKSSPKSKSTSDSQTRVNATKRQEKKGQPEKDTIEKALELYKLCELESKETVIIEDIIQLTNSEKLNWVAGNDEESGIEIWATNYNKGLLALFRDMKQKKYQLVYFDDQKGFIQPYMKIVDLRQAIVHQIENREKRNVLVQTTGFLVRTNTFKCIKNHGVEDIIAVFKVISKTGNLVIVEAPAGHCTKCGVFYIHEYTYQRILSYGQPLCTVISEKQYTSGSYKKMNAGMAQQSLLRMCGYTVSASEGLTDSERRRILDTIISNGIMSRFDVIEYLTYFINMRKNDTKDMSEAIRKWNSDLRYVEGINVNSLKRYNVDRVYRIER